VTLALGTDLNSLDLRGSADQSLVVDSELVIVDDNGNEEPYKPEAL
jgi:hypothetical protein